MNDTIFDENIKLTPRLVRTEYFSCKPLYIAETQTRLPIRFVFLGLQTVADRDGRFLWKPDEIKLYIMPYDNVDFDRIMNVLHQCGFVRKYVIEGHEYGEIVNFHKLNWLNPHEKGSNIPAPTQESYVLPHDGCCTDLDEFDANGDGVVKRRRRPAKIENISDTHFRRGGQIFRKNGDMIVLCKGPDDLSEVITSFETVDGQIVGISAMKEMEWAESYPAANVHFEVLAAAQWLKDNPSRRKTLSGVSRFFSTWLNRAQNRGTGAQNNVTGSHDKDLDIVRSIRMRDNHRDVLEADYKMIN